MESVECKRFPSKLSAMAIHLIPELEMYVYYPSIKTIPLFCIPTLLTFSWERDHGETSHDANSKLFPKV